MNVVISEQDYGDLMQGIASINRILAGGLLQMPLAADTITTKRKASAKPSKQELKKAAAHELAKHLGHNILNYISL